ncbi:MAG: hypothetical protein P8Y58_00025 [Novosphingobium sp.]
MTFHRASEGIEALRWTAESLAALSSAGDPEARNGHARIHPFRYRQDMFRHRGAMLPDGNRAWQA